MMRYYNTRKTIQAIIDDLKTDSEVLVWFHINLYKLTIETNNKDVFFNDDNKDMVDKYLNVLRECLLFTDIEIIATNSILSNHISND